MIHAVECYDFDDEFGNPSGGLSGFGGPPGSSSGGGGGGTTGGLVRSKDGGNVNASGYGGI